MSPALFAAFVLFNGHNLDGWKTLSGEWAAQDNALVCSVVPGSIRSCFESDRYVLTFEYCNSSHGKNVMRINAHLDGTAGAEILLTPHGLRWSESQENHPPRPDDDWIEARIEMTPRVKASSKSKGEWLGDLNAGVPEDKRGFIALSCSERGLRIRNMRVSEQGFTSLFDGKSLKGWEPVGKDDHSKPNWKVEDGVLTCEHYEGYGNWLRTVESYDNFVIRLEYWLPAKGNSGVYLHAPLQGRVSQIGQEIQLLDNPAYPKLKPSQMTGSVYAGIAPEVDVPCPAGEWNAIEILSQGKRIRTTLNGVQLYDASLDDEKKDQQLLHHPLSTRRLTGFIGLQDHTGGPKFQNIRIRTLPATSKPAEGK